MRQDSKYCLSWIQHFQQHNNIITLSLVSIIIW